MVHTFAAGGNQPITISMPWGVTPGAPLKLWWNPMGNSLAVHHSQDWQALRKQSDGGEIFLVEAGCHHPGF